MRTAFLLWILLQPLIGQAQTDPKQYWIQFTDKTDTPFSLNSPLDFLSQRAIERREKQNIPLSENDLPVNQTYIQTVLNQGATYLTHSNWFNSVSVFVPNTAVLNSIMQLPFVVQTQAVGKIKNEENITDKFVKELSTKTIIAEQLTESDYGSAFNQINMLGGLTLHRAGYLGQGKIIAVLDAGFPSVNTLSAFEELRNDGRIVATYDFVSRNDFVFDDHPHGTMVLSTMAANLPGQMVGTAPKASYLLLRTENAAIEFPIEEDYWVAGAEFADSAGADIINTSLGYTTFDDPAYNHTYADMDGNTTRAAIGADIAASKGILMINSAGNSGNSTWKYIGTPADGDSVLAIGAVDSMGLSASFSSFGPASDGDIKPNVCAQGQLAVIVNTAGNVVRGNGTSFSGPILAGMAACLWQANPKSNNMAIFRAIEQSAHLFNAPNNLCGFGIPNFTKANLDLSGLNPQNINSSQLFPVFPNPFIDYLEGTFYSATEQDIEIRLVNYLGQVLKSKKGKAHSMVATPFRFSGLQHINVGVYALQILSTTEKYTVKVVKMKE